MDYFSDFDYKAMELIVQNYGAEGAVGLLKRVLRDQANEMSDFKLKEKSLEYREMAEILGDLLVK